MWPSRTREHAVSLFKSSALDIFKVSLRNRLQDKEIKLCNSAGCVFGCACLKKKSAILCLVVPSLKERQESPDVEGSSAEAVGAEWKEKSQRVYISESELILSFHVFSCVEHKTRLLPYGKVMVWVYSLKKAVQLRKLRKRQKKRNVKHYKLNNKSFFAPLSQSHNVYFWNDFNLLDVVELGYNVALTMLNEHFSFEHLTFQCSLVDGECNGNTMYTRTGQKYLFSQALN